MRTQKFHFCLAIPIIATLFVNILFADVSIEYVNYDNIPIPDFIWHANEGWGESGYANSYITIGDVNEFALITRIDVECQIYHDYWGDLVVALSTDSQGEFGHSDYNLYNREDGATSGFLHLSQTIHNFDGEPVNQGFYLNVWDWEGFGTGYIDYFRITVHFENVNPEIIIAYISTNWVESGDSFTVSVQATDPGDFMTVFFEYEMEDGFNNNVSEVSWENTGGDIIYYSEDIELNSIGIWQWRVYVEDQNSGISYFPGGGGWSPNLITVYIENDPPIIQMTPYFSPTEIGVGNTSTITVDVADPGDFINVYLAAQLVDGTNYFENQIDYLQNIGGDWNRYQEAFEFNITGNWHWRVYAEDDEGLITYWPTENEWAQQNLVVSPPIELGINSCISVSLNQNELATYSLNVPNTATFLVIKTIDLVGDPIDIYLSHETIPTIENYNLRSFNDSGDERIRIDASGSDGWNGQSLQNFNLLINEGVYYLRVYSTGESAVFNLDIKLEELDFPFSGTGMNITRGYNTSPTHQGNASYALDFAQDGCVSYGKPVLAAASGIISNSNMVSDHYGRKVIIDHGDGYITLYSHLATETVNENMQVQKGQVIGTFGDTGNVGGTACSYHPGTHLHFGLRKVGSETSLTAITSIKPEPMSGFHNFLFGQAFEGVNINNPEDMIIIDESENYPSNVIGDHQICELDACNEGYLGNMIWSLGTDDNSESASVIWEPELIVPGYYQVFAHLPSDNATAIVTYMINHTGVSEYVTINQASFADNIWVRLGSESGYYFDSNESNYVELTNYLVMGDQSVGFDAMMFIPPTLGFGGSYQEDAPLNLSAEFYMNSMVLINWYPPMTGTPNSYNIYRNEVLLISVSSSITEFIDSNINLNELYCYYITAIFEDSESNPTEELCVSTIPIPDCNGEYGGSAIINECGCVGGSTGLLIYWCYGCPNPTACNFDPVAIENDGSCIYPEGCNNWCEGDDGLPLEYDCFEECGESAVYDDCGVCDGDNSSCTGCMDETAFNYDPDVMIDCGIDCCEYPANDPVHFVVEIAETGGSSLVSIADISCFTEGDEIGLYDASGQTNYNDCTLQTGEILVGSGVFTGGQLDIVGIGSVDLCAFGGVQLPGYFDGNPILFKAWDSETDYEYTLSASQVNLILGNGTWGQVVTQTTIDACALVQGINLNALMWNNISFYVVPLDNDVTSVFSDAPILVVKDDASHYYAPTIPVNTIENMIPEKGYHVFLSGMEDHLLEVTGTLIGPASMPITINALMMNNIAYLLSTSSNIADVMADIPVLVVKDAGGHYYVPGIGVNTIDGSGGMQPGSGYEVFLTGMDSAVLTYSSSGMSRNYVDPYAEAVLIASQSQHYNIVPTGMSHPIIITDIQGTVDEGDEVAAYAGGVLVGATRIVDTDTPIVIATWEGYHELGVDIDGYTSGDAIDLRVWSQSAGKELKVSTDLDGNFYGITPLTTGSITVLTGDVVPAEYELIQNYPNPFNPITTIRYGLSEQSNVSIRVYDLNGGQITELVNNEQSAGTYLVTWNASSQSSGVYLVKMIAGDYQTVQKVMLVK